MVQKLFSVCPNGNKYFLNFSLLNTVFLGVKFYMQKLLEVTMQFRGPEVDEKVIYRGDVSRAKQG